MSDESDFEIMSSQPERQAHSIVPEDTVFKFKVQPLVGVLRKFGYKLKMGYKLPYTTTTGGYHIEFSTFLEPTVVGYKSEVVGDKWELTQEFETLDKRVEEEDVLEIASEDESWSGLDLLRSSVLQSSYDIVNLNNDRIHNFKCPLCSAVYELMNVCEDHVTREHPSWKNDLAVSNGAVSTSASPGFSKLVLSSGSPATVSVGGGVSGTQAIDLQADVFNTPKRSTAHTNPEWLKELKRNFKSDVIEKCSRDVQDAVENNTKLKNKRTKKEVRNSLINQTVSCLLDIFGGFDKPGVAEIRQIVSEMEFHYPAMFKEDDGLGYGLGGNKGNSGLANSILERFRTRGAELKKKTLFDNNEGVDEPVEKKKGKKKSIYGVDNDLWYGAKANAGAAESISSVNGEVSFEKRELVYSSRRGQLVAEFRESNKPIPHTCRGFFLDYRHLEKHFMDLSGTSGLTAVVEQNLKKQMGYLEAYLSYSIKTVDFSECLSGLDVACQVEYNGSFLYKYVELLRRAGDHFDKKGAVLVRYREEPPLTDSPHVVAICVDKAWIFEVWVDKMKVLGELTLVQGIASFLHLAFSFNLQYPKESQTVADIWQRKFAMYGTPTGTRTHSKKDSAMARINKYNMVLGEILSQ